MKPLKLTAFFAVLLIGLFSFNKSEKLNQPLNIDNLNVVEILSSQDLDCRPTSDYLFYVETSLVKKERGFSTVNASIYMKERATGNYSLIASENVAIPFHKGMISLNYEKASRDCEVVEFENGDIIVGNAQLGDYCFNELIKHEIVFNSYVNSTNKLLGLDRTI